MSYHCTAPVAAATESDCVTGGGERDDLWRDGRYTAYASCLALLCFLQRTDVREHWGNLVDMKDSLVVLNTSSQLYFSHECSPLALTFILGVE